VGLFDFRSKTAVHVQAATRRVALGEREGLRRELRARRDNSAD